MTGEALWAVIGAVLRGRRDRPARAHRLGGSSYSAISRIRSMRSSPWLASRPWIWSSSSRVGGGDRFGVGVGGGEASLDSLCHDLLGLVDERRDHLGLGDDPHDGAAHEEVALAPPGGDAEVGVACLAGAVDDAAHHRDLQREVALLEGGLRLPGDAR